MTPRHWIICTVGAASAFVVSGVAHGGVSERDWKTTGDGLLTYDDINQREWLDLTQSIVLDIGQTDSVGNFSFHYQRDVLDELESGGRFEGFQAASFPDVIVLAGSAGIDTNTTDFDTNGLAVGNLTLDPPPF